jgi:hypothetical protein
MTTPDLQKAPDAAQPAPLALPPGVTHATIFPRIDIPELSTPEQPAWVEIRNPGMMPPSALEEARAGMKDLELDDEGRPVDDEKAEPAVYNMLAKLIRRWNIPDIMADDDPLPLLPSPPRTAEVVKQAPGVVLKRLIELVAALQNPR